MSEKQDKSNFTKQTGRGVCDHFACRLSEEYDKIGLNNWLLDIADKADKKTHGHAANLVEIGDKLFIADLTLDVRSVASRDGSVKAAPASPCLTLPVPCDIYAACLRGETRLYQPPVIEKHGNTTTVWVRTGTARYREPVFKVLRGDHQSGWLWNDGVPFEDFLKMFAEVKKEKRKKK
ncbi:MAG: hypothetical protein LBH00_05260 [Planctomycetaceae bacterium]|nr:hypothetical protein [Planctomycetaceae bacterium]